MKLKQLLFLSFSLIGGLKAQECIELTPDAQERLQGHISYLASDQLEGRSPGGKGIIMAASYITGKLTEYGVNPGHEGTFLQHFEIPDWVTHVGSNHLIYKKDTLKPGKRYFPVQYASTGEVSGQTVFVKFGIVNQENGYDDYAKLKELKGKIFVMDISSPDGVHPHSEYIAQHDLGTRIELAKEKGAIAVVLVNLKGTASDMNPMFRSLKSKGVPVVFIQDVKLAKKIRKKKLISLATGLRENMVDAYNVVGELNNLSDRTIVIGAHYDHLGMGGESSLSGEKAIHNGADDNASGTAGLLELARYLSENRESYKAYNYIFIAFSGEERGLLGSSFYASYAKERELRFDCMLNMDMVGRMEDRTLAINGVGTSPIWGKMLEELSCGLEIKTSQSGVGPSDHTSFYYLDVPVLHFFTGTHRDYHKPSDDADKINFKGEAQTLGYMLSIIKALQKKEEIPFSSTKEESQSAPRFSVTLGVMPDYLYDGEGMKIDGVTKGKPASKAGMQAGDVVTKLGEVKVVDMMSYMKALSRYKKGDEVEVEYQREGEKKTVEVKF